MLFLAFSHMFTVLPCLESVELIVTWTLTQIGFTIVHLFVASSVLYHCISLRQGNIMDNHAMVALYLRKHGQEYNDDNVEYFCKACVSPVDEGTRHCRICDMCIMKYDHHSSWLGICVGSKNLR